MIILILKWNIVTDVEIKLRANDKISLLTNGANFCNNTNDNQLPIYLISSIKSSQRTQPTRPSYWKMREKELEEEYLRRMDVGRI
jgi:hypothetical protein